MAKRYVLLDGERRLRAAKTADIRVLKAIVFKGRPPELEILKAQGSIDFHHHRHSWGERIDLVQRLRKETRCSVNEIASMLNISQSLASKLSTGANVAPEVRQALDAGLIDVEKLGIIGAERDHSKQLELLRQADGLTRDQLRQKTRSNGQPAAIKTSVARFQLSKSVQVTVQGPKMDLGGAVNALLDTLRVLKKGQAESWDIVTASRVMKDRAKSPQ